MLENPDFIILYNIFIINPGEKKTNVRISSIAGGLYTHEANEALELVARAQEMMGIPEVVLGRGSGGG